MTLTETFADLPDLRTGPAQRRDLTEMILMALCAVQCGADSWVDVAEWAEDNEAWLKRYLVLEHGTPSHARSHRSSAARIRSMVSSVRAVLETSNPKLSAIRLMMTLSSGMPPASMAAINRRARAMSDNGLAETEGRLNRRCRKACMTDGEHTSVSGMTDQQPPLGRLDSSIMAP